MLEHIRYAVMPNHIEGGMKKMKCVTVEVVGVPDIRVDSITADRTQINVGEKVRVTAIVTNNGTAIGTAEVAFFLNGTRFTAPTIITLPPGASTEVYTDVGPIQEPGSYEICADIVG